MRNRILPLILALVVVFTSCQKEAGNQPNKNDKLFGTWDFLSLEATVKSTTISGSGTSEQKSVSSYAFDAENPTGTIAFDAVNIKTNELGYSVHTDVFNDLYIGGTLFDSFDMPLDMTMPKSSATTTYKAIGTDSIYLQSGFIMFDPASGGTSQATLPQGFKLSWENDILVMKSIISNNMTQDVGGVKAEVKFEGTQLVRLKKQ